VFGSLDLDWHQFVEVDQRLIRPEELNSLKGDSTKLRKTIGWEPEYTFETMLDEMIDFWMVEFKGKPATNTTTP